MKKNKFMSLSVIVLALILSFAGCGKAADSDSGNDNNNESAVENSDLNNPVIELCKDYKGYLADKLGVSESDIMESDASTFQNANAYEGTYYLCSDGSLPSMDCRVYDNADEAREYFEDCYDSFTESFSGENCEAEYLLEDDYGYIVVDGSISGCQTFGNRYSTGAEIYAGIYYAENTIVVIMPRNDISNGEVEEVISHLGLPMANGENT